MENKDKLEFLKEVKKNLEILTKETSTEENKNAQKFLTNLQKKNEDVNFILLLINSYEESLVFFGLKMFEELLDFKWENLSKMTQVSLKNFILQISNKPVYSDLNVTSSSFCDRKRGSFESEPHVRVFLKYPPPPSGATAAASDAYT